MLMSKFKMKNLRKLCHFLGIDFKITQDEPRKIHNQKYWRDLTCQTVKPRMMPCGQILDVINSYINGLANPRKYHKVDKFT